MCGFEEVLNFQRSAQTVIALGGMNQKTPMTTVMIEKLKVEKTNAYQVRQEEAIAIKTMTITKEQLDEFNELKEEVSDYTKAVNNAIEEVKNAEHNLSSAAESLKEANQALEDYKSLMDKELMNDAYLMNPAN